MHKNKHIFFILFSCLLHCVFSQGGFISNVYTTEGTNHWTGDFFETPSNNYVGFGLSSVKQNSVSAQVLNVIGLNHVGATQWIKTYGDVSMEYLGTYGAQRMALRVSDGIIYTGGIDHDTAVFNFGTLVKFDFNADILWQKYYTMAGNHLGPHCVTQCADGGYLIAGQLYAGGSDAPCFILKTNSTGDEIWRKTINKSPPNFADVKTIVQDGTTKKILLLGYQEIGTSSYDMILVLDSLGNEIYRDNFYTYSGMYMDVMQVSDGKFVAVGYLDDDSLPLRFSTFAYKFDINNPGTPIWEISLYRGFMICNFFECVTQLNDGTLLISGAFDSIAEYSDRYRILARMMKIDPASGQITWTKCYNYVIDSTKSNIQRSSSLNPTSDNGWVLSLRTYNIKNNPHVFIKFDSTGCDQPVEKCGPVGWKEISYNNRFRVYPQPADDVVYLEGAGQGEWVEVCDVQGRLLVRQEAKSSPVPVSMPGEKGIYILTVRESSGAIIYTGKVVRK